MLKEMVKNEIIDKKNIADEIISFIINEMKNIHLETSEFSNRTSEIVKIVTTLFEDPEKRIYIRQGITQYCLRVIDDKYISYTYGFYNQKDIKTEEGLKRFLKGIFVDDAYHHVSITIE